MAISGFREAQSTLLQGVISNLKDAISSLKEAKLNAYELEQYSSDAVAKKVTKDITDQLHHLEGTLSTAEHLKGQSRTASTLDRIAFLEARIASLQARIASPVNLKNIMSAVEKHLKTNHKGLEGWGEWEGDGSLFQCWNESKGLHLALEVKAKGKDGMQADIQITTNDEDDEILVETSQVIHADMSDEASVIQAIHDFMVKQAKHAH